MPPERFSCQCTRELDEKSSLPLGPESEGRNGAGIRELFHGVAKDRKYFYINDLGWLGRQDSNLEIPETSRDKTRDVPLDFSCKGSMCGGDGQID